jgi:hypothetical protein
MAGIYGVNRTAQMLRLDYYGLKKRVEQRTVVVGDAAKAKVPARFVELASLTFIGSCECSLELENVGGAKMRIQLKGIGRTDSDVRRPLAESTSRVGNDRGPLPDARSASVRGRGRAVSRRVPVRAGIARGDLPERRGCTPTEIAAGDGTLFIDLQVSNATS